MLRSKDQELVDLLCEQVAIQILLLYPLDLIIDYLEDLIGHNEVVFLPNIDESFAGNHLIAISVEIDLDHLQLVVSRLHNIMHVEPYALKDAGQFEDRVVKQLVSRFLFGQEEVLLALASDVK